MASRPCPRTPRRRSLTSRASARTAGQVVARSRLGVHPGSVPGGRRRAEFASVSSRRSRARWLRPPHQPRGARGGTPCATTARARCPGTRRRFLCAATAARRREPVIHPRDVIVAPLARSSWSPADRARGLPVPRGDAPASSSAREVVLVARGRPHLRVAERAEARPAARAVARNALRGGRRRVVQPPGGSNAGGFHALLAGDAVACASARRRGGGERAVISAGDARTGGASERIAGTSARSRARRPALRRPGGTEGRPPRPPRTGNRARRGRRRTTGLSRGRARSPTLRLSRVPEALCTPGVLPPLPSSPPGLGLAFLDPFLSSGPLPRLVHRARRLPPGPFPGWTQWGSRTESSPRWRRARHTNVPTRRQPRAREPPRPTRHTRARLQSRPRARRWAPAPWFCDRARRRRRRRQVGLRTPRERDARLADMRLRRRGGCRESATRDARRWGWRWCAIVEWPLSKAGAGRKVPLRRTWSSKQADCFRCRFSLVGATRGPGAHGGA